MSRLALCLAALLASTALGQLEFESPPINYHETAANNPISRLQEKIDQGATSLAWSDKHGYLPAVLEQLGIDPSSQALVFSQTSFQLRKISPQRPRAIYFNDENYVGWVQFGDVVEISTVDPKLGGVFYTLEQAESAKPRFVRDKGQCLTCHASSRTQGVPGHLVRSVFPDRGGVPLLGSGTFVTDHRSPFVQRWGGWYVTGQHGAMRHMGNVVADRSAPEKLDREAGANRRELASIVDVEPYLSPHSDLVALMVLEHQTQTHNAITRAAFEAQSTHHYDQTMNKALDRPADYQSETSQRRLAAAAEGLVKHLLFVDEFPLASPIRGASSFAADFAQGARRDRRGRSLRDLDLETRLFKHPCSYLIESDAFDALPPVVKTLVYRRLREILTGEDELAGFEHLVLADRRALHEILSELKPEYAK